MGQWREKEIGWIAEIRSHGYRLENKVSGGNGVYFLSEASREKVGASQRGRPKPPGWGKRISAVTKGVPHDWTPDGWERATATQFKAGMSNYHSLTDEQKSAHRARSKAQWEGISLDVRSAKARERNLTTWSNRTPEQRKEIGRKIAASRLRNAQTKSKVS